MATPVLSSAVWTSDTVCTLTFDIAVKAGGGAAPTLYVNGASVAHTLAGSGTTRTLTRSSGTTSLTDASHVYVAADAFQDNAGSDPITETWKLATTASCTNSTGLAAANIKCPESVSGLFAMFRADDLVGADNSNVSSWRDISGNGRHLDTASGTNPKLRTGANGYGNRNSVEFTSASSQYIKTNANFFTSDFNSNHTIFVVARTRNASPNNQWFIANQQTGTVAKLHFGKTDLLPNQCSLDYNAGCRTPDGTSYQVYAIKHAHSAGVGEYENDERVVCAGYLFQQRVRNTGATTVAAYDTLTDTPLSVGCAYLGTSSRYLNGDVAAVVVYNAALSDADMYAVQNWLLAHYGQDLPTDGMLMGIGDSLMMGTGDTTYNNVLTNAAVRISDQGKKLRTHNYGIGGAFITTISESDITGMIDNYYQAGKTNLLAVWVGHNDVAGGDGDAFYGTIKTYLAARKTANSGLKIAWIPCGPKVTNATTPDATYTTGRTEYNSQCLADAGFTNGTYADAVADWLDDATGLGDDDAPLTANLGYGAGSTYFNDTIHMKAAGYDVVASYLETALEGLLIQAPTVTTTAASVVSSTRVNCGGNVTADGGATVTARGICYNTTGTPTVSDSTVAASAGGTGSYSANMFNLVPGRRYYIRAYATNSVGTSYGAQISIVWPLDRLSSPQEAIDAAGAATSGDQTVYLDAGNHYVDWDTGLTISFPGSDDVILQKIANRYGIVHLGPTGYYPVHTHRYERPE